jgi:hypothetical protein
MEEHERKIKYSAFFHYSILIPIIHKYTDREKGFCMNVLENRRITIYDFMAASMLSMFTVWIWEQVVALFLSQSSVTILTVLSYIVYTLAGIIISLLALRKNESKRLIDGFLIGLISSIATIIYYSLLIGVNTNFVTVVLVSFTIGGGIAGFVNKNLLQPKKRNK